MNVSGYLKEHGVNHGVLEYKLGRDGYSDDILPGLIEIEKRIKEIDQRLEVMRHLLARSQPVAIGRIDLTWQISDDGVVRPRLTQLTRMKKTGEWKAWTLRNDGAFRSLKRKGEFEANYALMKELMSLTGHLLKIRGELLGTLANVSRSVKGRLQKDAVVEVDVALSLLASKVGKLP